VGRKALLLMILLAGQAGAQADTTRPRTLDPVVVTADRAPGALRSSVSAVTRLSAATLARMPRATLADVLRMVPGFTVVDFDGLGFDPQLMTRGFYGGGEAEYAIVMVDGRPVNRLQNGTVSWDLLPPAASIEAVEVVRGSSSSLYGDAAIAAVINVITRHSPATNDVRWDASGGSFGTYRAAADATIPGWHAANLSAGFDRTDGFRNHASRQAGRAHASMGLWDKPDAHVTLDLDSRWRAFDEPGPQLATSPASDREASSPLFRFDHTRDHDHALSIDATNTLGAQARLSSSVTGEFRGTDGIRTVALAPGFGDTKERDATAGRVNGHVQLDLGDSPLPGDDRIVVGGDASYGALSSKYYLFTGGPPSAYVSASPSRGAVDTDSRSARTAGAVYAEYNARPVNAVRVTVGGRFDRIADDVTSESTTPSATHTAFSPKAGLNVAYMNESRATGNVYATVSRSFKAPTLDQLYDLRNVPVPFPPFKIHTSNPDLRPQYGVNVEAGAYQSVSISPKVQFDGSLSVSQIDMTDELDFDIASFKYVNIGKSRHRGVEAGTTLTGDRWSLNGAYTLQDATSRSGDNAGKRLKAIPRHTLGGGVSLRPLRLLETSVYATAVRDIFLDDANAVTLPNYTRVDARVSYAFGARQVFVDARNLFDAKYSTTGFMDPSGSGQRYLYPAAGRVLEVGVRGTGW
jgi:vitamin B12 transporter